VIKISWLIGIVPRYLGPQTIGCVARRTLAYAIVVIGLARVEPLVRIVANALVLIAIVLLVIVPLLILVLVTTDITNTTVCVGLVKP